MNRTLLLVACTAISFLSVAQDLKPVAFNPPSTVRGSSVMEAFQNRQFLRDYQSTDLVLQDLSDLLWATYGINRENGKRTAPVAQNSQDVDVYVCRAGIGLATGPRAGMDQEGVRKALNLKESQHIWLNHAVGYPADPK